MDGTIVSEAVSRQFGSPEWPLSREEHLAKARRCLAFGGRAQAHTGLIDLIERFDELDDVALALASVIE